MLATRLVCRGPYRAGCRARERGICVLGAVPGLQAAVHVSVAAGEILYVPAMWRVKYTPSLPRARATPPVPYSRTRARSMMMVEQGSRLQYLSTVGRLVGTDLCRRSVWFGFRVSVQLVDRSQLFSPSV